MPEVAKVNSLAIDDIAKIMGMDVPTGALAEDVEGDNVNSNTMTLSGGYYRSDNIEVGGDLTLATKTLTFASNSLTFAAGFASCTDQYGTALKLRLFMGGVQMQESAYLSGAASLNYVLRDFKALSGSQTCYLSAHNYYTSARGIYFYGWTANSECPAGIAVGSVKLV